MMETFNVIYYKNDNVFLNQRLNVRDSNPNSWYNFYDHLPLIAPVIAKQALY